MKTDSRRLKSLSILTFLAIGMFFSASLVGAFFHPGSSLKRFSTAGEVEMSARLAHESELQDETTFRINLNSAFDDVSRYKLKELSFLSVDGGPFVQAAEWEATGDARHIQGILRFKGHNLHDSQRVQLIVRGIGDADDQIFEWQSKDKK